MQRLEGHRTKKADFLKEWSRLLQASTKSLRVQVWSCPANQM